MKLLTMAFLIIGIFFVFVAPNASSGARRSRKFGRKTNYTVALILPKIVFGTRKYHKAVSDAIAALNKSRNPKFEFLADGQVQVHSEMISLTPSPTGTVCRRLRWGRRISVKYVSQGSKEVKNSSRIFKHPNKFGPSNTGV